MSVSVAERSWALEAYEAGVRVRVRVWVCLGFGFGLGIGSGSGYCYCYSTPYPFLGHGLLTPWCSPSTRGVLCFRQTAI
eukprot:8058191-Pyramimonas_sp.AAC.1